jgi:hypothetical protein
VFAYLDEARALAAVEGSLDLRRHRVLHFGDERENLPERQAAQCPVHEEARAAHGGAAHHPPSAQQARQSAAGGACASRAHVRSERSGATHARRARACIGAQGLQRIIRCIKHMRLSESSYTPPHYHYLLRLIAASIVHAVRGAHEPEPGT